MRLQKSGPAGGNRDGPESCDNLSISRDLPECKLHEQPIIDSLPAGCPLACVAERPPRGVFRALKAIEDESHFWQDYARGNRQGWGLALMQRYHTCFRCADQLAHPVIQMLQERIKTETEQAKAAPVRMAARPIVRPAAPSVVIPNRKRGLRKREVVNVG